MRWWFPWYVGAEAVAATAEEEAAAVPGRWTAVSPTAQTWTAEGAILLPRFNRVYQQEPGTPQFVRTDDAVN